MSMCIYIYIIWFVSHGYFKSYCAMWCPSWELPLLVHFMNQKVGFMVIITTMVRWGKTHQRMLTINIHKPYSYLGCKPT